MVTEDKGAMMDITGLPHADATAAGTAVRPVSSEDDADDDAMRVAEETAGAAAGTGVGVGSAARVG